MQYGDPLGGPGKGSKPQDPEKRFWSMVDKTVDGCWLWTGGISANTGYANFWFGGRTVSAHRWAYERFVGPIPRGLHLDHVRDRGCGHRHCVNPAHLEAVTQRENNLRADGLAADNARKTHCRHGHPFDEANTYVDRRGRRNCRICRDDAMLRYLERKREKRAGQLCVEKTQ